MYSELQPALDIIINRFEPDMVVLFGSRPRCLSNESSDYDLFILKDGVEHRRMFAQDVYRCLIGTGLPIDVIIETPSRYEELKNDQNSIYHEIHTYGEIIYEKH